MGLFDKKKDTPTKSKTSTPQAVELSPTDVETLPYLRSPFPNFIFLLNNVTPSSSTVSKDVKEISLFRKTVLVELPPQQVTSPKECLSHVTKIISLIVSFASDNAKTNMRLARVNRVWFSECNSNETWKRLFQSFSQGKSTLGIDKNLLFKEQYALLSSQAQKAKSKGTKIAAKFVSKNEGGGWGDIAKAAAHRMSTKMDNQNTENENSASSSPSSATITPKDSKADLLAPGSPAEANRKSKTADDLAKEVKKEDDTKKSDVKKAEPKSSEPSTPASEPATSPTVTEEPKEVKKPAAKVKVDTIQPLDPAPFYPNGEFKNLPYKEEPDETSLVWSEQKDGKKFIAQATFNKLIEMLTSTSYFDQYFLSTFMITFRSFTDRDKLLDALVDRYNMPPPEDCTPESFAQFKKEKLDKVRVRVTQTVKYWIESFFHFDFDEEALKKLDSVISMMDKTNGEAYSKIIRRAIERANEDLKNQQQQQNANQAKIAYPAPMLPKKTLFGKKKKFGILDYPTMEIARQLTLIEFTMFAKIEPKECLNQSWVKEHRLTKAPNISKMTNWFNLFAAWIGTQIVQTENLQERIKVVQQMIELAACCRELNNYNAVFCITSGLGSSAVYRLKDTWGGLPEESKKVLEELHQLTSRDKNFKKVRDTIKTLKPPIIPYIGLYLTDLTFIEDGNKKYIDGKVNFEKCKLFAEVIRDMQTYQNTKYIFQEVNELKDMLVGIDGTIMTEKDMYDQSLKIEERKRKPTPSVSRTDKVKVASQNLTAEKSPVPEEEEKMVETEKL